MDYKNYNDDDAFSSNIISTNIHDCLFSTTSTSPPSTPTAAAAATTNDESILAGPGLYRARLILENQLYNELRNRYQLAITRLRQLSREATALHEENEWLRLANEDLSNRFNRVLSVSEQPCGSPVMANRWSTSSSNGDYNQNNVLSGDYSSPTSVINDDEEEEQDDERFALPRSISVRSPGFFKVENSPTIESQTRSPSRHVNGRRLKVRKEEKAIEMEVFNQGMYKTELCNKWQETGTCPYGQHCQFAHGLSELRPVIRHPRYKTQICRMVVAGVACPYGHRCHFRHSLP